VSSDREEGEGAGDDGYVHEPGSLDSDDAAASVAADSAGGETQTEAEEDGFGRQGWLLVAGVVGCFLVIPGVIYLRPAVPAAAGLSFFATFLVLPLIPAVILGLLAVWSMRAAA
jgi:hypothetical protein